MDRIKNRANLPVQNESIDHGNKGMGGGMWSSIPEEKHSKQFWGQDYVLDIAEKNSAIDQLSGEK